jgi:hypothetical protein
MTGVVAEALRAKAVRREGAVLELEVLGRNVERRERWDGVAS